MGIKLEWEIEAEQSVVKGDGEDKQARRRRRMAQLRLLIGILILVSLFGSVIGFFMWRLQIVDNEIRRALIDTVGAEVTTLRVSDRNAFLEIQRSASPAWEDAQQATFDEYQALKVSYDVQLTGNVVNVQIDGSRGRVEVEEIIDGVPYVQTWFYWRYADVGWRHVPSDYTFWGELTSIDREQVIVRYQGVDQPLAEEIANRVDEWLNFACGTLNCEGMPPIAIEIVPIEGLEVAWSDTNSWLLRVPSPFTGRARYDRPFDTALQVAVAETIAERVIQQAIGTVQAVETSDAAYLKQAVEDWLIGTFTQTDRQSYLINSYTTRYGVGALQNVLTTLGAGGTLQVLNAPAGVSSLAELEIDWRDYLQWRLATEDRLRLRGDEAGHISLYDTRDPQIASLASSRFIQQVGEVEHNVISVQLDTDPNGAPVLRSVDQIGESQTVIEFRLVDGLWKRIN